MEDVQTGVQFQVGTGFLQADRALLWAAKETLPGQLITYKGTPTAIAPLEIRNEISIAPNPSSGNFSLNMRGYEKKFNLQVLDPVGKKMFESDLHQENQTLNLSFLSKGIYFLKLDGNSLSTVKKLVIQ